MPWTQSAEYWRIEPARVDSEPPCVSLDGLLPNMRAPFVATDQQTLREQLAAARRAGKSVGLVPTMGALHEGHLSLVRRSVDECGFTVATIFVNPTQFGPQEDFSRYPRTLESDLAALREARTDLVFVPSADEMYPQGCSTSIDPPDVAKPLEGVCRPGHFRGVATIVLKLFHLIPADVAYFGQKDYQQCRVIEDMVRDLDVPIQIAICPIVREPDGLAMSSRNRYLSDEERQQALALVRSLQLARDMVARGDRECERIVGQMRATLAAAGISRVDYVAITHPTSLAEIPIVPDDAVALIAAHVGTTRLIDNCRLG